MSKINLRDVDPYYYTNDLNIEVSDEVAAEFSEEDRLEHNFVERVRYNGAYYSLDRGDGIEYDASFHSPTPAEVFDGKLEVEQLYAAIVALPDKQSIRICQYYFLDMSMTEIAWLEGVTASSVSESIRLGIQKMRCNFWNFKKQP